MRTASNFVRQSIGLALAGSIAIAGIWLTFAAVLNRDVGWWLYVTGQWLDGARLYVDIIEVNPPLMGYLAAVPVGLGSLFGVDSITSFRVFVLLLVAASIATSAILVSRAAPKWRQGTSYVALLLFALLLVSAGEFGQREHLMLLLVCPYISLIWCRLRRCQVPTIAAVLVGLAAGIGIGLKPQFVVLGLGIEGWLLFKEDVKAAWRRPEALTATALVTLYTVFVLVVHAEYIDLAIRYFDVYGDFRTLPIPSLLRPGYVLPVGAAVLAVYLVPQPPESRDLARAFLVFSVFALLMAVLQRKGWLYHYYPADAASVLAVGISAVGAYSVRTVTRRVRLRRVASVGLCGTALLLGLYDQLPYWRGDPLLEQKLAVASCEDTSLDSVLLLSGYMGDAFPYVLYSGCEWASPFPQMWLVHALYADAAEKSEIIRFRSSARQSDLERSFVQDVSAKFAATLPDLIFVHAGPDPALGGGTFPYLEYFSQDPQFAAALEDYRPVGNCRQFAIYSRERTTAVDSIGCEAQFTGERP